MRGVIRALPKVRNSRSALNISSGDTPVGMVAKIEVAGRSAVILLFGEAVFLANGAADSESASRQIKESASCKSQGERAVGNTPGGEGDSFWDDVFDSAAGARRQYVYPYRYPQFQAGGTGAKNVSGRRFRLLHLPTNSGLRPRRNILLARLPRTASLARGTLSYTQEDTQPDL